jgi:glycine cleavage system H lipoate-binding protein
VKRLHGVLYESMGIDLELLFRFARNDPNTTGEGMLTALFLTSIIVVILLHFLLVERPRMKAAQVEPSLPEPLPLEEALSGLPEGAYIQPTLTWCRVLPDGHLLVGIHPALVSLVGAPYKLELTPEGWSIGRGSSLLRIRRGNRRLQVLSPVAGKIVEVNPHACGERGWNRPRNPDECWIYRVLPENLIWEIPGWMQGPQAESWIQDRFGQIERFVVQIRGEEGPGSAGSGGSGERVGEPVLSVGVLSDLDSAAWRTFEDHFLTP